MDRVQVAQHAEDLGRGACFYERLLGAPPVARFDPPGLLFFNLGQTRLLLETSAPSALLYLRVEDVGTRTEELRAVGVPVETEPHTIFHHNDDSLGPAGCDEWQSFLSDSEGNPVALVSHDMP